MPVVLNDSKVLLDSSKVATSTNCCCDCQSCDDLVPTGDPPPQHINVVVALSGSCGNVTFSGSITYDQDLGFGLAGPIGGHFFCLHNIFNNSFGAFWTGHFTVTCDLDGSHADFFGDGTNGLLGRETNTCEWWFELDMPHDIGGAIGTCVGCFITFTQIFEVIAPPGDPSGVYIFTETVSGVTATVTVTIT